MCVIVACTEAKPNRRDFDRMWACNPDGGGVAWLHDRKVAFLRGLMDADSLYQAMQAAPLPCVVHFRLASSGGIEPELTHPFPIRRDGQLALSGTTDSVLFHNGHYSGPLVDAVTGKKSGSWSDTRVIANLVRTFGFASVSTMMSGQKLVLLGKTRPYITLSGTFIPFQGYSVSNSWWNYVAVDRRSLPTHYYPSHSHRCPTCHKVTQCRFYSCDSPTYRDVLCDKCVKETRVTQCDLCQEYDAAPVYVKSVQGYLCRDCRYEMDLGSVL